MAKSPASAVAGTMLGLTTKQSMQLAVQRAVESQMVRLFEVWSANSAQGDEEDAWRKFALGLDKVAEARETIMKLISEMPDA